MVYIPLTIVLIIDTIALIAYKNRQRQMMLVRLTFILLAVVFALSTLTIMGVKDLATEEVFVPGMALISPFFAFICNYLALRAIRKDEELVRSVNRIR
jgi:lipopolysaccharide export LptBFGC system permease protein LptF